MHPHQVMRMLFISTFQVQSTSLFVENFDAMTSGAEHRNIIPIRRHFQKNQTDILLYIQFHF